ncbi:MAG TPA: hypothetical protein VHF26_22855 [Trebonia sp.]|nr:hypothetical protein [Trebonia sp.]
MRAGQDDPRQRTFDAYGRGGQPVGLVGHADRSPGRPAGPGGRLPRGWPTWWIAPYLGGGLAVLAVFVVLQLTVLSRPAGHGSPAASSTAAAAATGPMPAQIFPDALFKQLTKDIQGGNEKGFLSLVAPGARPAVQTWWDNMQAIGFTTGLVMPTNKTDQVNLDAKGDGTTVVLAGTHNALDPENNKGQPDVPLERYQIGLHFSSPTAIGQITSWKPLGDDPWDQGGKLYVRKGTNVVVAGPAADSAAVDETLPIAQAAAAYDVGLINHVHPSDLRQTGFVVFVSGNADVRSQWFSTTKQPSGWPPASTSLTAQLPGPGASADTQWNLGNLADDFTGGARVVITPFEDENGGTAQTETAELVARFALDILSANDQPLIPGAPPPAVPAWAIEGFGVAFEAAFDGNSSPTPDSYDFSVLNEALRALPASYKNGDVPTAAELFSGSAQTEQNWRVVAGSVYAYIATRDGMGQLLASADLMWTSEPDPRQNVLESNSKGTLTFFGKDTIQAGWKAYMASPTDLAPAVGPSGV